MTTLPRRPRPSTRHVARHCAGPASRAARATRAGAALAATAVTATAALALAVPASAATGAPADPQVVEVLDRTNAARAATGCAPLELMPEMTVAAGQHSDEMASTGRTTHTGTDGSSPRTRLAAVGVTPWRTAENVARGYDADSVVDAWMRSPGHRANILDCRLISVGIAESSGAGGAFWTQVFASA